MLDIMLKTEEETIPSFEVPDEALEIAGSDKTHFTYGVCTLDQPGCFPSILSVTRTRTGSLRSAGGSWRACLVRRRNRHSKH